MGSKYEGQMPATEEIKIKVEICPNTADVLKKMIDRATTIGANIEFEIMVYNNMIFMPTDEDTPTPLQPEGKNASLTVKLT
jgi:hypothetical protein